jgi:hypothetical protein
LKNRKIYLFIILVTLFAVSCMSSEHIVYKPINTNPNIEEVKNIIIGEWNFIGGDTPNMKIIFKPDGTITFIIGFEYYTHSTWKIVNNYIIIETFDHKYFKKKIKIEIVESDMTKLLNKNNIISLKDNRFNFHGWIYSKN